MALQIELPQTEGIEDDGDPIFFVRMTKEPVWFKVTLTAASWEELAVRKTLNLASSVG